MLNLILNTVITVALIVGTFYAPIFKVNSLQPKDNGGMLGAFTELASTDTMSAFPTTYNANLTKTIEVGTTTIPTITTLTGLTTASALATVGTITSGTWSATAVGVSKGGTGTTSPSTWMVMLGNGANGLTMASTTGVSGQFLTSNGAGAYPSWQTSSVTQTADYNFTSTYFGVRQLYASSTVSYPLTLNAVAYDMPSTQGASSTVLTNDGAGHLKWQMAGWTLLARQTFGAVATATVSFSPRDNLMVFVHSAGGGSENGQTMMTFFDSTIDPNPTFGYKVYEDVTKKYSGYGDVTTVIGNFGLATTSPSEIVLNIKNATSTRKVISYTGAYNPAVSEPYNVTGSLVWATTTRQINQINLGAYRWTDTPANWTSGMTIEVYGNSQ